MSLPLPLVPFENYMLADDTQAYPRTFVIQLQLSGRLERPALERAWQVALQRHPLLCARLEKQRGTCRWVAGPREAARIDWRDPTTPIDFAHAESFRLDHEAGVRLWVRADDDSARLVLQFHHACCDGVGGLQFIGDLLAAYAAGVPQDVSQDESAPALRPLDDALLAQRANFGETKPTLREMIRDIRYVLGDSWRLLWRRSLSVALPRRTAQPTRSEAGGPNAGQLTAFPGIETYTFSEEEFQAIRSAARGTGATLNDLLMCCWFQALQAWNALNGEPASGWLRLNIPTSLRLKQHEQMPAANVMSFTFVDRRSEHCGDTRGLLASIRQEMEAVRLWRLGLSFIAQMSVLGGIPGGMRLLLGDRRCLATAVLTNVGDPSRRFNVRFPRRAGKLVAGNLILESISGVPPLRANTRAGVGVFTYAGGLTLSLTCDRHTFAPDDCRRLLDEYVAQIRRSVVELAAPANVAEPAAAAR